MAGCAAAPAGAPAHSSQEEIRGSLVATGQRDEMVALADVPMPEPQPGEALVKVREYLDSLHAAQVLFFDG